MENESGIIHRYIPPRDSSDSGTLVLFHGTGGDEESMLQLGSMVSPQSGLLSPRGKVLENGMPRFFRRLSEGVFDQEDLKIRTHELALFINSASDDYGLDVSKLSALGYSNGANIAGSLILTYPDLFNKAVLFHPMVPFIPESLPDLSDVRILITAGTNDPIVKSEESENLLNLFKNAGAHAEIAWYGSGHSLTRDELEKARNFLL